MSDFLFRHNFSAVVLILLCIGGITLVLGDGQKEQAQEQTRDETLEVVIFQALMAVVGGLSYWGVQVRKANNLSLFDRRKRESASVRLVT